MILLDANVLVAFLTRDDKFHERVLRFFDKRAPDQFAVSALTLAESLVHPVRHGRVEEARRALNALGLNTLGVVADDALPLARIRESTGLRLPDAIVLHSAERAGAELATADARVVNAARALGIVVSDLSHEKAL